MRTFLHPSLRLISQSLHTFPKRELLINASNTGRKSHPLRTFSIGFILFLTGYGITVKPWGEYENATDETKVNDLKLLEISPLMNKLKNHKGFQEIRHSSLFPKEHKFYHVGIGLLSGKGHLTIDPILFSREEEGTLYAFYHLGENLCGHDGVIHNGILSTIMDEGLCFAGFPLLPHKYGVTGRLDLTFNAPVPPNSFVVLKAQVSEIKDRKCVITGTLEMVPLDGGNGKQLVEGTCYLIEPRWAKYISWLLPSPQTSI